MRITTFTENGTTRTGVIAGDTVVETGLASMIELISRWPEVRPDLEARAARGGGLPLRAVTLEAPVPRPGKIFAIGLNYADHVAESGAETPKQQVWFTKAQTAVNPPFAPIRIAASGPFVDYEVEMVAVIGAGGRNIPVAEAHRSVFGFCVGNDVTERAWQHATPQWSLGKSFDTHAPLGPYITTADEIEDPHALDLACYVNGDRRQASNTRHLIFNVWEQIAHLSRAMTLEPGDLIFTGTPGGVGAALTPRQFLKPGDQVRCVVEGLGEISAVMAAEGASGDGPAVA